MMLLMRAVPQTPVKGLSMIELRRKYSGLSRGYLYHLISIRMTSHPPRTRTLVVFLRAQMLNVVLVIGHQ